MTLLFWDIIKDICILSAMLMIAALLRNKLRFLQKMMVPNNVIAGFIGFILSDQIFGLFKVSQERMGEFVYHLLAITFIAMSLRREKHGESSSIAETGFIMTFGYLFQAILGMGVAILLISTIMPDLFPNFGYLLLLGFGQGPGQAYALGSSWEAAGFSNGGNLGLTFAAIGYIWSCLVGVPLVYYLMKQNKNISNSEASVELRTGFITDEEKQPSAGKLTTMSDAMDGLAAQIMLIGIVYLITYCTLKSIEIGIFSYGQEKMQVQIVKSLWGFHFIIAAVLAILVRKILERFGYGFLTDNGLMTCIAGSSVDYMVVAALTSISISVFLNYFTAIFITTTLGGFGTLFLILFLMRRNRQGLLMEHTTGIFGTLTGTLSTGLGLMRISDPYFRTRAANDLVFGSGFATPLTLPVMASMLLPIYGKSQPDPIRYYLYTLGGLCAYGLVVLITYILWRQFQNKKNQK